MLAITITILSAAAVSCATPSSRNYVASLSAGSLRRSAVPAGALMRLRGGQYSLGLRDSIMIAHSFKGEEFGPAQNMHGATYTVDVEFQVDELVRSDLCVPGACSSRAHVFEAPTPTAHPSCTDQEGTVHPGCQPRHSPDFYCSGSTPQLGA